jgi:hypothetical protein
MSATALRPATQIMMALCQRKLQQTRVVEQPFLDMLVNGEDTLPVELAQLLDNIAAVYADAASDIRRRHYLGARRAKRSPSVRTPCLAAGKG